MTEAEIKHFLIIYDLDTGISKVRDFDLDYDGALAAYAEAEGNLKRNGNQEVVLVGADSIETVRRTHSSYFHTEDSFESLLPAGVLTP